MKLYPLQEYMDMPDRSFPVKVLHFIFKERSTIVPSHWHEHMEFIYVKKGAVSIQLNKNIYNASSGAIVVINSNDIHSFERICEELEYYCLIFDFSVIRSSFTDKCQEDYITPLSQNTVLFKNLINDDPQLKQCMDEIILEYTQKQSGYELAVKGCIFKLLSLLTRKYINRTLSQKESGYRQKNLLRFKGILEYIEQNFTERIMLEELSSMAGISSYHFCRLFKDITGRSYSDYINNLRLNKAEFLLKSTSMNVTEVALSCGFNDMNYFSRIYKKYKRISPSKVREII